MRSHQIKRRTWKIGNRVRMARAQWLFDCLRRWRAFTHKAGLYAMMTTMMLATVPTFSRAQASILWPGPAAVYDAEGAYDSLTVGMSGANVVEIHHTAYGILFYRTGRLDGNGTLSWGDSHPYDHNPVLRRTVSVAASGTTVVAVNEGEVRSLRYRTGHFYSNGDIGWADSITYDTSREDFRPSVALSGTTAVEVHERYCQTCTSSFHPFCYRTGRLQSNGTIQWSNSIEYDSDGGFNPQVSMSGTTVVEVHERLSDVPLETPFLCYRTGKLQANGTIQWNHSVVLGRGRFPSISVSGSTVVALQHGNAPVPPISAVWYRAGLIQSDGSIQWGCVSEFPVKGQITSIATSGAIVVEVADMKPHVPLTSRVGFVTSNQAGSCPP